ncbi:MAG TPA: putative porin [Methylophilaceae bacterium]|jgi:hypothetical protein
MQFTTKPRLIAVAVTSLFLLGMTTVAKADSTDDLLRKLHDKGILNDQEYNDFNSTRDTEQAKNASDKASWNKGKIKIGSFIDNATIYGDIRVRYEHRDGEDDAIVQNSENRDRGRYKITLGIKTEAANFFYSDLALAMGANGRSDNATFGGTNAAAGADNKQALFVKRALIGWHGVDWLTVEAGRVSNPLYTTEMVWDKDLNMEGLTEQLSYTVGNTELFGNFGQSLYNGDATNFAGPGTTTDTPDAFLFAWQAGAKVKLSDQLSAKAALTLYTYTHDKNAVSGGAVSTNRVFSPGIGNGAITTGTTVGANLGAINDLMPLEIPFELNYKASNTYTVSGFGDFVKNLDGDDRKNAACTAGVVASYNAATRTAVCNAGTDDIAWMLGAGLKYAQGKEAAAGDWQARIWWQDVGIYSLDPNTVDSDFMDSRLNMQGVVFKAQYNVEDNVFFNIAAGHGSRKNKSLSATTTAGNDLNINIDDYNLYQMDLTYKF